MKKSLLLSIFLASFVSLYSQSFSIQSVNVPITTTNSCSAIQVDVTTFLACSNYVRGPFSYRVDPNVPLTPIIMLEVNYYSTPNCIGPVSNPVFNFSLMNIPTGSYDLLIFG